jgi:chromosomal replication initiation ATPase DnaA
MSLKSMMDTAQETTAVQVKDEDAPSDEVLKAKWPELAKMYGDKPRLASMLTTTSLVVEESEGFKTVTFRVVNDAQKDWVESKLLHELEGNYRKVVGSMKVYLRVTVAPDDAPQQKKIYMPSEQAKELMAQNEEVKSLVKDLELDIK